MAQLDIPSGQYTSCQGKVLAVFKVFNYILYYAAINSNARQRSGTKPRLCCTRFGKRGTAVSS